MCAIAWIDFFFITCANKSIYKKSSENHDFYVAKVFLISMFFLCDDALDNMCDRQIPLIKSWLNQNLPSLATYDFTKLSKVASSFCLNKLLDSSIVCDWRSFLRASQSARTVDDLNCKFWYCGDLVDLLNRSDSLGASSCFFRFAKVLFFISCWHWSILSRWSLLMCSESVKSCVVSMREFSELTMYKVSFSFSKLLLAKSRAS